MAQVTITDFRAAFSGRPVIFAAMSKKVRVRFAPSPTGGLHLGGVRTVLYNYLFARHHGGQFILRIEDTDQSRFVEGAEQYIIDCLNWCGLIPDEGPEQGGPFAPYRQSERKPDYRAYAEQLVEQGFAYYAFDTPAELEQMRTDFKTTENPSPQYNSVIRNRMRNSLTLPADQVQQLLKTENYVVRIKMPDNEEIVFNDMIRGQVSFHSSQVDDKVLLKADGMPTYHLAVVVDDHAMQVSHAFRGEEWLPSAPVHILLWKYLGWETDMPQWAHLPLILKPDGNGKLSKRDGDRLGFPVFAMDWKDPKTGETTSGFKERGFLPQAFVNMLAMLGWNDGTGKEIFTIEELIERFSMDRVHSSGAKFDFEKAKWFNHEWIKLMEPAALRPLVHEQLAQQGILVKNEDQLNSVISMVKDRCTLINDFVLQAGFFFKTPESIDADSIKPKWSVEKANFFNAFVESLAAETEWSAINVELRFKELATAAGIKPGDLMLPLRIMLVGGKFGPGVFDIAATIGQEETISRMKDALAKL
jgi:glutamyl-tRNA synthetase